MRTVNITIDGKALGVPEGTSVLEAARQAGIYIPSLCYHPKISITGACRVCIVEINGQTTTSCTTPAEDGMAVITNSPYIENMRRDIVDLILSDHPYDCMVCQRAGDCELQELAYFYNIRQPIFKGERRTYARRDKNPFIDRDMEKCILCGRCIKVCDEVQGVGAIDYAFKGFDTRICPPFGRDLNCEFCGQCVAVCPTGALSGRMWIGSGRYKDVRETETICPYCGCGCNITLHTLRDNVIRVSSRTDTPNEGWLCSKGRFNYEFINSPDRLTAPLVRRRKSGELEPATWDEALGLVAAQFSRIRKEHGPDALAGLASARCTNEENYAFQKFFRAAIGTNNVDHCARY